MEQKKIIETIQHFLIEEFEVEPEKITNDANLTDTLELDSLDFIDLAVTVENKFKFKVSPEDLSDINTLDDFYKYVILKVNSKELA